MATTTDRLDAPKCTNNMLADVCNWLEKGDCIVLHNAGRSTQIYHRCALKEKLEASNDQFRVIFLDVRHEPDLLLEGEWPWYIKDSGSQICTCDLKDRVTKHPHQFHYQVPNIYSYN